jgi:hypothetical protein
MKRMFRVALSYTVAVEANSDAQAFVAAQYASPLDPSVRKLSATVIASWIDKPKEADLPQPIPAAPVTHFYPDNDSGKPPVSSTDDVERPGRPEEDIPF